MEKTPKTSTESDFDRRTTWSLPGNTAADRKLVVHNTQIIRMLISHESMEINHIFQRFIDEYIDILGQVRC